MKVCEARKIRRLADLFLIAGFSDIHMIGRLYRGWQSMDGLMANGASDLIVLPMEPVDIIVRRSRPTDPGVALVWKGHLEIQNIVKFFVLAAERVFGSKGVRCRGGVTTQTGALELEFAGLNPILGQFANVTFLELECRSDGDDGSTDNDFPELAVFGNLDSRGGTSLENTPQSVGVYIRNKNAVGVLLEDIASTVAMTTSDFFPGRRGYDQRFVLERLKDALKKGVLVPN